MIGERGVEVEGLFSMLILADRAGLYLSNAFDIIQISRLEQKLCKKNLPQIIINKQRGEFTTTPLALNI